MLAAGPSKWAGEGQARLPGTVPWADPVPCSSTSLSEGHLAVGRTVGSILGHQVFGISLCRFWEAGHTPLPTCHPVYQPQVPLRGVTPTLWEQHEAHRKLQGPVTDPGLCPEALVLLLGPGLGSPPVSSGGEAWPGSLPLCSSHLGRPPGGCSLPDGGSWSSAEGTVGWVCGCSWLPGSTGHLGVHVPFWSCLQCGVGVLPAPCPPQSSNTGLPE